MISHRSFVSSQSCDNHRRTCGEITFKYFTGLSIKYQALNEAENDQRGNNKTNNER